MAYNDVRHEINTGDIVLFSGSGGISHGIKLVTNSKWSHVGMVLRLPQYKAVFLWESTTLSNLKDAIDGRIKKGVQLILLSDRLQTYNGDVCLRPLKNHQVSLESYGNLMDLRESLRNRPYEKDQIELIRAAYDGPLGDNAEDLSSLFCSELAAEAYQALGLLQSPPIGTPSNEFTPSDFAKDLPLQSGATLGDLVSLVD